jgi:Flp pilus assembly protein TadG
MSGRRFSLRRFKSLHRFVHATDGATAVEMALITPVFFLFMIGLVETTLMITVQNVLENAAYNTSRVASTGYTASGKTQSQTITDTLNTELGSLGGLIDITKMQMTSTAYANMGAITAGGGTNGAGTASQVVVYTIVYPWKVFTPMMAQILGNNGVINLTSRIVVQNEPY